MSLASGWISMRSRLRQMSTSRGTTRFCSGGPCTSYQQCYRLHCITICTVSLQQGLYSLSSRVRSTSEVSPLSAPGPPAPASLTTPAGALHPPDLFREIDALLPTHTCTCGDVWCGNFISQPWDWLDRLSPLWSINRTATFPWGGLVL